MKNLTFAMACFTLLDCSGSSSGGVGTGGGMTTGGEQTTGGIAPIVGGASSVGGTMTANTGGMPMTTGGAMATGGETSTGGAMSNGGMAQTGGMKSTGGAKATGGELATGGSTGTSNGCSGSTSVSLSVKNYLAWCSVAVASDPASSAAKQTVCVAPGSVNLTATALVGFQLGNTPWHGTSGDTGSGTMGTVTGTGQSAKSMTTVDVTAGTACVWVCCEFTSGGGCPTTNQCP
jgi:hypothetical protein